MSNQLNHTAQEINRKLQLIRTNGIALAPAYSSSSSSDPEVQEGLDLASGILHFVYEDEE